MNTKCTVVCVIGTRPEAIKMAPVVAALHAREQIHCVVVATAQHRGLLDQMLQRLVVPVDHDLDLMTGDQTPNQLMANMLPALDKLLAAERADIVLAQGDTVSVLGAALTAFHRKIPFGHVEAGLRTHDLERPYPEEGYRQMVARIAHWHFAPTKGAALHLREEGIASDRIHVTGNTGIDTLLQTVAKLGPMSQQDHRTILLTAHRRESFGNPLHNVFTAVRQLADRREDVEIVYPVHPNPNVREHARTMLGGHPRIRLLPPQDYFDFVELMRSATLILTDSGGIQEEAPALGKPVLVLRDTTERPEGVEAGVAQLVGTDIGAIVDGTENLLDNAEIYARMAKGVSPFGDGRAAARIVDLLA